MRNENRGKIFGYSTDLEKFVKGGGAGSRMTRISLLCSRSAHTGIVGSEINGGAPSTGAVGATCVPFLERTRRKAVLTGTRRVSARRGRSRTFARAMRDLLAPTDLRR